MTLKIFLCFFHTHPLPPNSGSASTPIKPFSNNILTTPESSLCSSSILRTKGKICSRASLATKFKKYKIEII